MLPDTNRPPPGVAGFDGFPTGRCAVHSEPCLSDAAKQGSRSHLDESPPSSEWPVQADRRPASMRPRSIGVVLLSALSFSYLGCGGAPSREGMRTVSVFDLKAVLGSARIKAPKPEFVKIVQMTIDKQRREVVLMHPVSSVEFPSLKVTKGSWIQFGVGISEEAWSNGTDGVVFSASIRRADGRQTKIFSRYLDPAHVTADQRWVDVEVPLSQFAGSEVAVVLESAAGPNGDRTADWAGWSSPRVFIESER